MRHTTSIRRGGPLALCLFVSTGLFACDEKPKPKPTASSAKAAPAESKKAPTPKELPRVTVTEKNLYVDGKTIPKGTRNPEKDAEKLFAEFSGMKGKPMELYVNRKARHRHLYLGLRAMGRKGVTEFRIGTPYRSGKKEILKVTPAPLVKGLPGCTVAVKLRKNNTMASWSLKGGRALGYPRGMAGPDMTATIDGIRKAAKRCKASKTLIVVGAKDTQWGLLFDLVLRIKKEAKDISFDRYVIPEGETPAGKPVKLIQTDE